MDLNGQPKQRGRKKGSFKNKFLDDGRRVCSLCQEPKDVSDFTVDKSRRDGLSPRCSTCRKLSKKYVPCERCGGLRFGDTKGLCRACWTNGKLESVQPNVQWKSTWGNNPRKLQNILKPIAKKGKNCACCGKWFTFTGNSSKRKVCGSECGRALGRQLARSLSLLPYDFNILYDLYWNQGLSTNQIANKYGLANNGRSKSGANVYTRMQALGIPTRKKGVHVSRSECVIDGCEAPIHKVLHKQNGFYGRRCLEHWVAHRHKLAQDYWQNTVKWRKLGLGENANPDSLGERIEKVVPKSLPYEIRDEVVQELALKVMLREVSIEELEQGAVRKYIKHFYHEYQDKFGALSIDAPIGEDGFTLADILEG
jgi:hypothetical protein